MDAYVVLLFAVPIVGLISAMVLVARSPEHFSVQREIRTPGHGLRPHR
jgi:hypothetical protein